jgi:hypothetical protein
LDGAKDGGDISLGNGFIKFLRSHQNTVALKFYLSLEQPQQRHVHVAMIQLLTAEEREPD